MTISPKQIIWLKRIINVLMILFLIGISLSLICCIISLWPDDPVTSIKLNTITISAEQRLLLLMACGGALGAFLHMATSFTDFLGNQQLAYSWIPWYIIRPFIGSSLAIIFYLLIRGGLITAQASSGAASSVPPLNPYGIMAVACLAGLFSKQAIDKLREVFETLFKIEKPTPREDPLKK